VKKPYVIAEAGVNFYDTAQSKTPLEEAMYYALRAKESGVDAIKFQSYKAKTLASKNTPAYWDTSEEATKSQFELFTKYDHFGRDEYWQISKYCKEIGIDFLSTPFDYKSVDYLNEMVSAYKISSSDLSNLPFVKYIARKEKPIYLSVGASYLSEVEEAVRMIRENGCQDVSLLHCVLSYPCSPENANLNIIKTLKRIFPDTTIGYSDHTKPDESMAILSTAYLLGAEIIEKHYTLDKTLPGNDHYHGADPSDFARAIRNFTLINRILGKEDKTVLPCEQIPRREARRSIVVTRHLNTGDTIEEKDVTAKRPGTGISPKFMETVIGRKVLCDCPEDTVLTWEIV